MRGGTIIWSPDWVGKFAREYDLVVLAGSAASGRAPQLGYVFVPKVQVNHGGSPPWLRAATLLISPTAPSLW